MNHYARTAGRIPLDRQGFLIGGGLVFVLNTLNYHLAYHNIEWFSSYFFATYGNDLLIGLIVWTVIFSLLRVMEKRGRLALSAPLRFGLVLLVSVALLVLGTELTSEAINGHPVRAHFYTEFIPILMLEVVIFNLLYLSFGHLEARPAPRQKKLELIRKSENFLVSPTDIAFFHVENGVTRAVDCEAKFYVSQLPLQQLAERLPDEFFRLNRQYLARKEAIDSFEKRKNKTIAVKLQAKAEPHIVVVSRANAPAFKRWIKS
ncbi:MAG: LytTR family DNA-binding domain-containing protein [Bacteroidota bacterium]